MSTFGSAPRTNIPEVDRALNQVYRGLEDLARTTGLAEASASRAALNFQRQERDIEEIRDDILAQVHVDLDQVIISVRQKREDVSFTALRVSVSTAGVTNLPVNATPSKLESGDKLKVVHRDTGQVREVTVSTDTSAGATFIPINSTDFDDSNWIAGSAVELFSSTLRSAIIVNKDEIDLRVEKNDVINQINISTEGILIDGDNIEISGATTFTTGYDPSERADVQRAAAEPSTRSDGSDLKVGDVWIDTDDGDRPYVVSSVGPVVWSKAYTAITGGDITTNTITASNIASDTITASEIAADTITAAEIAANTITASEIAADTITASEIAANTITASEIAADTITAAEIAAGTITGSEISSSTTITAGSGNNVGVLDGADATYRIYAGNATPGSAPFRVTQAGALTATSATITGDITATSGSLSGLDISGTLTMGASGEITNSGGDYTIGDSGFEMAVVSGNAFDAAKGIKWSTDYAQIYALTSGTGQAVTELVLTANNKFAGDQPKITLIADDVELTASVSATINGNTIWHAGNDGAGSGLDADLLDGVQGAGYLRSDTSDSFTGATLTVDNDLTVSGQINAVATAAGADFSITGTDTYRIRHGGTGDLELLANAGNMLLFTGADGDDIFIRTRGSAGAIRLEVNNGTNFVVACNYNGTDATLGFFDHATQTQQTVSGSRADTEAALANLLTALDGYGIIVDSTTAS